MHRTMKAEEFLKILEADPEYRNRRAAEEARLAERSALLAADEEALIFEIGSRGYDIDSVWDLVNNDPHPVLERRFVGPYPGVYDLLVRHLLVKHHPSIREGIIRALTVRDGGKPVEEALLREFEAESDPQLRWVLANALKVVMPYHRRRRHPEIAQVFRNPSA